MPKMNLHQEFSYNSKAPPVSPEAATAWPVTEFDWAEWAKEEQDRRDRNEFTWMQSPAIPTPAEIADLTFKIKTGELTLTDRRETR